MTTGRKARQRYTSEQKADFFALFDELQNNTETARRLGLNKQGTYQWLRAAGLRAHGKRGHGPHPERARYNELRQGGISRRDAAAAVGVHLRTAGDWDRGTRHSRNRRHFADGRIVDYTTGVTEYVDPPDPEGTRASISALDRPIHPKFLSLEEREQIRDFSRAGSSIRDIARSLGRPPSTISGEIRRNLSTPGIYHPYAAHRKAVNRRPRPKPRKLATSGPLRTYVQGKLSAFWSPEQISRSLKVDHPNAPEMRVATETIYQTLYLQGRGQLRREIAAVLRNGKVRRTPRRQAQKRQPRFTDPIVMISDRPAEAADRSVPGHWEGDLIIGKDSASQIGTLVERSTRYVMLVHLPGTRDATTVREALLSTMSQLPSHLRRSLTWDQGAEMAEHKKFSAAASMPVYFCDPASPWQRGSNENTNRLLRQYFPKGSDLSAHGCEELERVARQLNTRPRKTLGWKTPAAQLAALLSPG